MTDYRRIEAWKLADDLTVAIYDTTRAFPREELYGLTSQVRQAAYSVPANIAEGSSRDSKRDYLHFLYIARGRLVNDLRQSRKLGTMNRSKRIDLGAAQSGGGPAPAPAFRAIPARLLSYSLALRAFTECSRRPTRTDCLRSRQETNRLPPAVAPPPLGFNRLCAIFAGSIWLGLASHSSKCSGNCQTLRVPRQSRGFPQ